MRVRVKKVVRSEEEVLYFPQLLNWWWQYFESKDCCWEPARFKTEEEAWDFIKFRQEYPKISYSYNEKNGDPN